MGDKILVRMERQETVSDVHFANPVRQTAGLLAEAVAREVKPPLSDVQFHPPQLVAELVSRPELWSKLEQCLILPLAVVIAPGGYGKTTTVASWFMSSRVRHTNCMFAWYSINPLDNHLHRFCSQLLTAVEGVQPEVCRQSRLMLTGGGHDLNPEILAMQFVQDIAGLSNRIVLVLDDCHSMTNPGIHRFWETVVRWSPATLSLILVSRHEMPFSIARLRSQRRVLELRLDDLKFNHRETEQFLTNLLPTQPGTAALLHRYLEGWPAGICLSALSLQTHAGLDHLLAGFRQNLPHHLVDYFMDEVLAEQPGEVQHFLLKTSLLPVLHPSLCAIVMGNADLLESQALLADIVKHNLFVIRLGEKHDSYRYHDLFQAMLQERLRVTLPVYEVDTLCIRIAQWYTSAGEIEQAITFYLAGHSPLAATEVLLECVPSLQNHEQWHLLDRYLALLPLPLIEANPALLLAQSWLLQFRWQSQQQLQRRVEQISRLLVNPLSSWPDGQRARWQAELNLLSMHPLAPSQDMATCEAWATDALNSIPPDCQFLRGTLWRYLARAYQRSGAIERALAVLDRAEADASPEMAPYTARLAQARCVILWFAGQYNTLTQAAATYLRIAQQAQLLMSTATAHFLLGSALYYQANADDAAAYHLESVLEQPYMSAVRTQYLAAYYLIDLWATRGNVTHARQIIANLRAVHYTFDSSQIQLSLDALEVALCVHARTDIEPTSWLRTVDPEFVDLTTPTDGLIWISALLAIRTVDSVRMAQAGVHTLQERCEQLHYDALEVYLLVFDACCCAALGEWSKALTRLRSAIKRAQAEKFCRPFLFMDPLLGVLLQELGADHLYQPFVNELLTRRGRMYPAEQSNVSATFRLDTPPLRSESRTTDQPVVRSAPRLLEPLTYRESEIIRLLEKGFSNAEIASSLVISIHTVRKHVSNILDKLGSQSRTDAVARARRLGLI